MKYVARIGYLDRYTGTDYEEVEIEARNEKDATKKALEIGNERAYRYCPDTFFVEKVWKAS